MNINRNNYEEFFLLYVDNELSVQQKNAVDVFLTENPDLQEEMVMLRQSILIPDESVFADKQSLLKQEVVNDEMQTQLLLMLDNELDKKTTGKLLGLVKKDASVKQEWEILQQTKLSAKEKIIFKDKAILYKEEGGRVIAVRWWRIAAAAVVIGFGVWGVLNYSNRFVSIPGAGETVISKPGKSSAKPVVPEGKNLQPAVEDKSSSVDNGTAVNQTKQDEQIKPASPVKTKIIVETSNKQKRLAPQQVNDIAKQPAIKTVPTNDLPKPSLENFNSVPRNNNDVATVSPSDNNKIDEAINTEETTTTNEFASQIKYIDSDADNQVEVKGAKSKLGGFFKKLKRVVERKTNMKSGDNSFKIANMSFAVQ